MNTQEVRIPWVWDTTGVERGAQNMERATNRVKKAMESGNVGANSGAGTTHGKGNNFIWALRDMAEGRTGYAIMRLLSGLKASATSVGAISVGYVLARQFQEAREELDKLAKDLREFGEQNREQSRRGLFATPGMGGNALLSESMAQWRVQQAMSGKQLETEDELNPGKHPLRSFVNLLDKIGRRGASALGVPIDPKTEVERAQQQAELDRRVAAKGDPRLMRIASQAFSAEANIAEKWRNPHEAQLDQLVLDRDTAQSMARLNGASEGDIDNIGRKFRAMISAVQGAEEVKKLQFTGALAQQQIAGGPKVGVLRALALAAQEGRNADAILHSEGATRDERRTAELASGGAINTRNAALMGLYLNADGRRRPHGAILRDLREARHAERRRARFLRSIDSIDPETGYHRVRQADTHWGLTSGGLRSGGLESGGVTKGSLDAIFDLLNARLPKEVSK